MSRHRASSMIHMYGLNYCADHTNGLIYEYSVDIFTDNGDPIIKERDTADVHGGLFDVPGKTLFFDQVEFVIISGPAEVAGTGLGPQPIIPGGLCGLESDLDQGQLLNIGPISMMLAPAQCIGETDPVGNGVSFDNSKIISFTCALMRKNTPDPGLSVHGMDIYNVTNGTSSLAWYMDSDGYMNLKGRNQVGTTILDVQITNNGGSFADEGLHMFAIVVDLNDEERREIYHNNSNIGEGTWVTWNTYTDDVIQLEDTGSAPTELTYYFGRQQGLVAWGQDGVYNGTGDGATGRTDALGYISFDDTCSLIPKAVWDDNGYVRDPQAWNGWYLEKPQVFFGPSLWMNSGKTAPATYGANNMEHDMSIGYATEDPDGLEQQIDAALINLGIGSTTEAISTDDTGSLPDAPDADPQVELVAPFWSNTGNWIDLSKLTQTTYLGMFGVVIEGADFNKQVDVNKAALVNTADDGNRMLLQDSTEFDKASLILTDSTGNIIDSVIYAGVPNGNSILIPTDANYYVVITSDTAIARVKKWDTTP